MTERDIRTLLISSLIALSIIASITNSYYILLLVSALSATVFLYLIYRLHLFHQLSRFLLLSSLSCGTWLSIAFLLSYVASTSAGFNVTDFPILFSATTISISPSLYSISFSYLLAFVLVINTVSEFSWLRKAESEFSIVLTHYLIHVPFSSVRATLLLVSLLLSYVSSARLLAVRGLDQNYYSDQGILPWWFVAIDLILGTLPLLIALFLRRGLHRLNVLDRILVLYSVATGFYFCFIQGRFAVIMYFLMIPASLLFFSKSNIRFTSKLFFKLIFLLFAIYSLIPLIVSTFAYLHFLRYQSGVSTNPFEVFAHYLAFLSRSSDIVELASSQSFNLIHRPLVLWPLASSIQMWFDGSYLGFIGFNDLLNSFLNAIPRLLINSKEHLLLQEDLLYQSFPFSTVDIPDSPYLFSFASFGLAGLAIYPIAIASLYYLALRMSILVARGPLARWFKRLFVLLVASQLLTFALQSYAELATTQLIRIFLVIIFLAMPLVALGYVLPVKKLKVEGPPGYKP